MGELQLEMCYYNEKLAVWEPLLEPVMDTEDNYRPWEILIKVRHSLIHDCLVLGSFLCNFYVVKPNIDQYKVWFCWLKN